MKRPWVIAFLVFVLWVSLGAVSVVIWQIDGRFEPYTKNYCPTPACSPQGKAAWAVVGGPISLTFSIINVVAYWARSL